MPHPEECKGTRLVNANEQALVQAVLHVLSPLLIRFADAVHGAAPVSTDTLFRTSTSDSTAQTSAVLGPCTLPNELRDTTSPQSSTSFSLPSARAHVSVCAPTLGESPAQTSTPSSGTSSPSSLDKTRVFSFNDSPTEDTQHSTAPSVALTASPQVTALGDASIASLTLVGSQQEAKGCGQLKRIYTTTPSPREPLNIVRIVRAVNKSEDSNEAADTEVEEKANTSGFFFTLPNVLLWEAVAALAEATLVDGSCFCWLRAATCGVDGVASVNSDDGGGHKGGTRTRSSSSNATSKQKRKRKREETAESTLTLPGAREGAEANSAAHLLANVLFQLHHYAKEELHTYIAAKATAAREMGSGEPLMAEANAERLFPALAAALVRAVALRTARMLSPLMCEEGTEHSEDRGCLSTVPLARPSRTLEGADEANSTVTFRAVQAELKEHRRQSQAPRHLHADLSHTRKCASTTQGKRREVRSPALTLSMSPDEAAPPSPSLLPRLSTRVAAAQELDESSFVLCLTHTALPASQRSPCVRAGDGAAPVVQEEASVLMESAEGSMVVLSSVLSDGLQGGALHQQPPPEASQASRAVPLQNRKKELLSYQLLLSWCIGLQQLATTMTVAGVKGSKAEQAASGLWLSDYTASAARLYHYLRDCAVYPHMEHVTRYTVGKDQSMLAPSHSFATTAEADGISEQDDKLLMEEDDHMTSRKLPWTTALWSLRPCSELQNLTDTVSVEREHDLQPSAVPHPTLYTAPMRRRRRDGEATAVAMRAKADVPQPVASGGAVMPSVEWVRLAKDPQSRDDDVSAPLLAVGTTGSTTSVFQHLIPPPTATRSTSTSPCVRLPTENVTEVLNEVGAVLACIDAVCSSRTLLDASSWRYGRNRFNIAVASIVSVASTAANGSHASPSIASAPTEEEKAPTAAVHKVNGAGNEPRASDGDVIAFGLYHYESGLLHVADGATYALELE